jgi:prephenate dehydrogenase
VTVAEPEPIAVIGLGAIGGSVARALLAHRVRVRAWALDARDRYLARSAGLEVPDDGGGGIAAAVHGARIAVLAVPIEALPSVARAAVDAAPRSALVVHTCGLQHRRRIGLDDALADRLLGTHPLAGSHARGFAAARPNMFFGASVSIEACGDGEKEARAAALWRDLGAARIDSRAPDEHDRLMSWVSHLPQLAATALACTLADASVAPAAAGPGARDTTRLAESAFAAWRGLLGAAPEESVAALVRLEDRIRDIREALETGTPDALFDSWQRAAACRRAAEGAS